MTTEDISYLFKFHVAIYRARARLRCDVLVGCLFCRWLVATVAPSFPFPHNKGMALPSPLQNLSALISASGNATTAARPPRTPARGRNWALHAAAPDTTAAAVAGGEVEVGGYEEGRLVRPNWTGETPLSRLVGALISFKPLYSVLKLGARQVLIRSMHAPPTLFHILVFLLESCI